MMFNDIAPRRDRILSAAGFLPLTLGDRCDADFNPIIGEALQSLLAVFFGKSV